LFLLLCPTQFFPFLVLPRIPNPILPFSCSSSYAQPNSCLVPCVSLFYSVISLHSKSLLQSPTEAQPCTKLQVQQIHRNPKFAFWSRGKYFVTPVLSWRIGHPANSWLLCCLEPKT
jgi:hypothetical protein